MLTEQQIIEEDFLEIKGEDICDGDVESIYYVVQLIQALIEREGEEVGEEGEEDHEQEQEEN